MKCSECSHQSFPPLDERAVESHLRGEQTLGVYAIGTDDTCRFLAADFDGGGWRDDVLAYREAAERVGIAVAIERSRSGDGAHAWIFFAEPVPAATARRLGTILVAKASALRPALGLGAYDRLFPNQDTLPVGGFGNLIALPLAKAPRQDGNTLFVEDNGVLCAPPGAGKTVMGCALIARTRTSALVLVHRAILVEQWRDTAMQFLGLKRKEIGLWRGPTPRLTGRFDIAMLPSLVRVENLTAALAGYGVSTTGPRLRALKQSEHIFPKITVGRFKNKASFEPAFKCLSRFTRGYERADPLG